MGRCASREVTGLLRAWSRGDQEALDRLVPLVWDELHRLAHRYLRRRHTSQTLQTTALVSELYLRLVDASRVEWQDRAHFFAISASLMRRVLVDVARARLSQKRGGRTLTVGLDEAQIPTPRQEVEVVAPHEALRSPATFDSRGARIVGPRFFGGLSVEETGEAIGISPRTVKREWAAAKVWLPGEMTR